MKKSLILFSLCLLLNTSVSASEPKAYEMPRTQVTPIQDSSSGGQYELYIKLPEEYSENRDNSYPVIYFTDAKYHMEILSGATEYIIEDAILVGVSWRKDIKDDLKEQYGEHASRFTDYSFWKKSNPNHPKLQFGQASNHLAFIRDDVIDYVEKSYRTDPNKRSYFGYSLGGLFGAYILVTQPDTFKNYILGSPSVDLLSKYKVEFTKKRLNANLFISHGTLEAEELREPISEFVTLLNARNDTSLSIESAVIEGSHQTAFPMTGVRAVTWLVNLTKDDESPVLKGPYLGQKPPGLTPEAFAPSGLSTEHRDGSGFFTPDMKEFYFTRRNFKDGKWSLVVFKSENNQWRESVAGPRVGRPIIAPDGKTMHLGKHYMERTETGWSEVKSLGPMFDREDWGIMRLSSSAEGTYVFDDAKNNDVIRISTIKDGKREEPKLLDEKINTGKWTAHPFIAPDESYLIWDSEREGGYGDSDLYISFRQKDGSWGSAINLGDKINTSASDAGAYVTPDGKYLFFNRYKSEEDSGMYWVDAQIIENLRPKL